MYDLTFDNDNDNAYEVELQAHMNISFNVKHLTIYYALDAF